TAEVAKTIILGGGQLLQSALTHVAVAGETEIDRAGERGERRNLAIKLPVHPVGAGVAKESIAGATKAQPNIGIGANWLIAPRGARHIEGLSNRAFNEIASRQERIPVSTDVGRSWIERDAHVEARLIRGADEINIRDVDDHVEITGDQLIDKSEAVVIPEDVMAAR